MPVDAQVQQILDQLATIEAPPLSEQSLEQVRSNIAMLAALASAPQGVATQDVSAATATGPVPVRLYRPPAEGEVPLPLLVWFHGGGWTVGDLELADPTARDLADQTGALVASVDYPLAPERPFPAAPEACYATTQWLFDHADELGADGSRLAVGGDSAGGNLAAVTALLARDRTGPDIRLQLLVYPVVDALMSYPSIRENGEGYLLTAEMMDWFVRHYLPNSGDAKDPEASPIYASDLSELPPALVITAEYDPLRDEGEAYAKRMEQAGVPVTLSRYPGMVHGFFSMTGVVAGSKKALAEAADAVRTAFGP